MLTNVPTADDLHRAALRLHFQSWSALIAIATEFESVFPEDDHWTIEKTDYLKGCQPDLHALCALIQQSNELGLKARIAEVSPYLLLRNDGKISRTQTNIDFSDLRTLDAHDLPGAVAAFSAAPLRDTFLTDFDQVRRLRNKILHLGSVDEEFNPEDMLQRLVRQFVELWSGRSWLRERLRQAQASRHAIFHDGKYSSPEGEVFLELDESLVRFGKRDFKVLLGFEKSMKRYLCPQCYYNSEARRSGLDPSSCLTAFEVAERKEVECAMCCERFPTSEERCVISECVGRLLADGPEDLCGMCLTCGEY